MTFVVELNAVFTRVYKVFQKLTYFFKAKTQQTEALCNIN